MPNPGESELRRGETLWGTKPPAVAFKITKWSAVKSGQMLGFLSVQTPAGMVIPDLRLMKSKGGLWIGLPSRAVLDNEGRHLIIGGKKTYQPTIDFKDRSTRERFVKGVLAAVHARWPRGIEENAS
jgi:DNA-binding cell septation regulator SpoVG